MPAMTQTDVLVVGAGPTGIVKPYLIGPGVLVDCNCSLPESHWRTGTVAQATSRVARRRLSRSNQASMARPMAT
jgi:hypothetical protein